MSYKSSLDKMLYEMGARDPWPSPTVPRYSHLQVREAASQLLMDAPERERVTVSCRFVAQALGSLRQADRMYNTAVQASMQLALEIRRDLEVMMHLTATCSDREKVGTK